MRAALIVAAAFVAGCGGSYRPAPVEPPTGRVANVVRELSADGRYGVNFGCQSSVVVGWVRFDRPIARVPAEQVSAFLDGSNVRPVVEAVRMATDHGRDAWFDCRYDEVASRGQVRAFLEAYGP